ncbi:Nmad3 family putative nucleotide modification protein [Massilia haematophila]|uniref:Nucleotide modification associated domain-containing protein n=1 Tax=Massilia haematophila TaxID=457923 RepID=A0ABV7PG45_9BURK
MNVVLLRVGVDSGSGGMQGPLFADGSFELIPIPDNKGHGTTYGASRGKKGIALSEYFAPSRRALMATKSMHLDPEFETFTYGDPTPPKSSLRTLRPGDMLVFYAGLEGWDHVSPAALYIVGYFVVEWAGVAAAAPAEQIRKCGENFHVKYEQVYQEQRDRLVLVKGGAGSRLLTKAYCISSLSKDRSGNPLKVISPEAQKIFGDFGGRISLQRSPPRWVVSQHAEQAQAFVKSLP